MTVCVARVRVSIWLRKTFPERQVYIRSAGRVQFFTFGPSLQVAVAGCVLVFLGWTAFATINVIFKDRTIAAKDHRYQQAEAAYEDRLSGLEVSYRDLDDALTQSERSFSATVTRLKSKQNVVADLFADKSHADAAVGASADVAPMQALNGNGPATVYSFDQAASRAMNASRREYSLSRHFHGLYAAAIDTLPHDLKEIAARFVSVAAYLVTAGHRQFSSGLGREYGQHPVLNALAYQIDRVRQLDRSEAVVMAQTEASFDHQIERLRRIVGRTGISPDKYFGKLAASEGMGSPEIPLDEVQIQGISDPVFTQAYLHTVAALDRLHVVSAAIRRIPLATPVGVGQFNRTSGFGPRLDPFTGHYAFHPGLDFGCPWGAAVVATAPGTVVFAGDRGSYGNMVEIDHGIGMHTRYAHLSVVTVRVGVEVGKGAVVGRVGSTGRSTGPHVHYEVWYDNTVRNPALFIAAGGSTYREVPGATDN